MRTTLLWSYPPNETSWVPHKYIESRAQYRGLVEEYERVISID